MSQQLLLKEGSLPLEQQVNSARCRNGDFDPIFVCSVDRAGIREGLPWWFNNYETLGCVSIDTTRAEDWERGSRIHSRQKIGRASSSSFLSSAARHGD